MTRLAATTLAATLVIGGIACSSSEPGGGAIDEGACVNVGGNIEMAGLTIRRSEEDVRACVEVDGVEGRHPAKICQPKAPDLSCVGAAAPKGAPILVTYTGCVTTFGVGAQSNDLVVSAFREFEANNEGTPVDPGYDIQGTTGAQGENTASAKLGSTISTLAATADCPDLGAFRLDNIPTETDLIVRVTDQHIERARRTYVDTYQYNILLRNAAIRQGPSRMANLVGDPAVYCATNPCYVVDDVNTIVETTFRTIALSAGVSSIPGGNDLWDGEGQGHIAGEVQDCTSEDRLQNAVVALNVSARKLAYFNVGYFAEGDQDDLADPLPEGSRTRTNADGLYAAIGVDTPSGGVPVKVGAAITGSVCGPDGVCRCENGEQNPAWSAADPGEAETRLLGSRTIYVFPDSITILTFDRGLYVVRN